MEPNSEEFMISSEKNSEVKSGRENIIRFLENSENIIEPQYGRKCVDGRYTSEQGRGMIARPGGDYGYVLSLMSVLDSHDGEYTQYLNSKISPEDCFDMVYQAITRNGGKFFMHSDEHDDGDHIGCGHAALPLSNAHEYGFKSSDIPKRILERARYLTELEKDSPNKTIIWENLHGDHNEKAVLVVMGDKTVAAHGTDVQGNNMMNFVYDAKRDQQFISGTLLPYLRYSLNILPHDYPKFEKQFFEYTNLQTEATLQQLAMHLPRYSINVDDEEPLVEENSVNNAPDSSLITKLNEPELSKAA